MFITKLKRVIRTGFVNFWRNGFLSLASILVVTLSLLVFGGLIFFSILTNTYLTAVKEKVDVNVYFTLSAEEADILHLKTSLESLPEVAAVEYISRDQALENFKLRHADDTLTLQGLEEIGENPLPATLNVKAKEPQQYGSVAKFLESDEALSSDGKTIVESVNYNKNKDIIDRLANIVSSTERLGLIVSIVLGLVAVIVTFNTIRLTIYSSRDEIAVMKLVGASNMYIRGPFVVSGIMYGIVSAVIALLLFYPITYYLGRITTNFSENFTLLNYYIANFAQIFGIIILSGIILGAISSYLAVRRYLNV